ncbi:MAG: hypothetical protein AAFV43_11700 [Planctomycetota bacterium]
MAPFALAVLLAAAATGEPVYWGSRELALPYRQTTSMGVSIRPTLYVSTDAGRSWRVAARTADYAGGFRFVAAADGEHLFAVRSDIAGGSTAATLASELTVVVDTVRPTVLDAVATQTGDLVTLRVTASDAVALDPRSLQVYAQTPGAARWGPAPLRQTSSASDERRVEAVGQIRLNSPSDKLRVQIFVSDKAGNRAEETRALSLNEPTARERSPDQRPTDPFQVASRRRPVTHTNPFVAPKAAPSVWGAIDAVPPPRQAAPQVWPRDAVRSGKPLSAASEPGGPAAPFRSAAFAKGETPRADSIAPSSDAAPGVGVRVVSSERFEFDYEVDAAGKWGVSAVELWGTSDDGRSWRRFALDSDLRSPIHVETPGEGDYGFKLLVTSVGGLPPATPRPGDEPDARVRVDLRRPALAITGVSQGAGYFADRVSVHWTADDENPADRAIDLAYATRREGPWTPIATGVENTGRYQWRLQRHLPRTVFVRVTARDAGGNVATAVTRSPLTIDMPSPAGTLRSVRSASR